MADATVNTVSNTDVVKDTKKPKRPPSRRTKKSTGPSFLSQAIAPFMMAVAAAVLFCVVPRPGDILPPFERATTPVDHSWDLGGREGVYTRTDVSFPAVDGTPLAAWLYRPVWLDPAPGSGLPPPDLPLVIMAHGLGGQKDFGLHRYADAYAYSGFAVLVFDYRSFGASGGEPRHIVSPHLHLQDWQAAVNYAQSPALQGQVRATRLILWGTSYAGGHALTMAARLKDQVAAVVVQVPHLSGRAASLASSSARGKLATLRLGAAGVYDLLRSKLGLPPAYVKIAGRHGEVAFMSLNDVEMEAYLAKHPEVKEGGWRNQAAARLALEAPTYSPMDTLGDITAPVMFVSALKDTLCPHEVVERASTLVRQGRLFSYDVDHFSLYIGHVWEDVVGKQLWFMCDVTGHACPPAEDPAEPAAVEEEEEGGKIPVVLKMEQDPETGEFRFVQSGIMGEDGKPQYDREVDPDVAAAAGAMASEMLTKAHRERVAAAAAAAADAGPAGAADEEEGEEEEDA